MLPPTARWVWLAGLGLLVLLRRWSWIRLRPHQVALYGVWLAGLYMTAMVFVSQETSTWVRTELTRQGVIDVQRLMVGPSPANPARWRVVAETPGAYRHGTMSWLPNRTLRLHARPIPRLPSTPPVQAALAAPHVQGIVGWMRFPFAEVVDDADGYTVYLLDARYVLSRTRGFGSAVVELDRQLNIPPPTR
jgi:hypothetical protein